MSMDFKAITAQCPQTEGEPADSQTKGKRSAPYHVSVNDTPLSLRHADSFMATRSAFVGATINWHHVGATTNWHHVDATTNWHYVGATTNWHHVGTTTNWHHAAVLGEELLHLMEPKCSLPCQQQPTKNCIFIKLSYFYKLLIRHI